MKDHPVTGGASTFGESPSRPVTLVLVSRTGGGALRVVARLADSWASRGRDVRVLTNLVNSHEWDSLPRHVPIVPLPPLPPTSNAPKIVQGMRFGRYVLKAGASCRRDARARRSESYVAFLPGTALLVLAATLRLPNPIIVCERNDLTRQPVPSIIRLGRRLLYPLSSAVTVNHAASRMAARRMAGRSPTYLLENPPPTPAEPADVRRSQTVLNVGRLVTQKNQLGLLQAFGRVRMHGPLGSQLRIVGDGPLRAALEHAAERLDLSEVIQFTGHVNDVSIHYQDAAFLVLTSSWEGTPNVVLEAQAHGLPVLLPRTIADGSNLITEGEDGLVYDAGTPSDLERCLTALMMDSELRVRLGATAHTRAVRRHRADVAGDWLKLLDSLPAARR